MLAGSHQFVHTDNVKALGSSMRLGYLLTERAHSNNGNSDSFQEDNQDRNIFSKSETILLVG